MHIDQLKAKQRPGFQIERRHGLPTCQRQQALVQVPIQSGFAAGNHVVRRRIDHHIRHTIAVLQKATTQGFVAFDDFADGFVEGIKIDLTSELHREGHVISHAAGVHLVDKP